MNKKDNEPYKSWLINGLYCLLYKELSSTNLTGIALMNTGKIAGSSAIISDSQINGRGQLRTKWHASPEKNLTFSIVIPKLKLNVLNQFKLNKAFCLAVHYTLLPYCNDLKIKWPNDIYYKDQKLGGILIENQIQGNSIKSCVIGLGLNINEDYWPDDLLNPVSLKEISKSNFDIEKLQNEFPIKIFNSFTEFFNKSAGSIDKLYHELLYGINEWRRFQDEDNEFEGRIIGTNGLGNLSVENKKGTVKHYPLKSIRFIF
jgi:BirA family biotin operon repressor/biotin-[acetyl-CoA-carboxylase] ligase